MRYEALITAVLVLSQIAASPASAAPGDGSAAPQFTAAETSTVGRNELLRALIETDPWLVRRILDAVAGRDAADGDAVGGPAFMSNAFYTGAAPSADIAPGRTDAASAEWLSLLRQVRDEKTKTHHGRTHHNKTAHSHTGHSDRSAKGSLDLLETLKKARKEKGGGK